MSLSIAQEDINKISLAAIAQYLSLPVNGKPHPYEHTAMAAILLSFPPNVMNEALYTDGTTKIHDNTDELVVLALATGTKVLPGSRRAPDGSAVNDCHAEVVVRRAFMRWLYDEIDMIVASNYTKKSLFLTTTTRSTTTTTTTTTTTQPSPSTPAGGAIGVDEEDDDHQSTTTGFCVRPGVKVYLFVSHPPCGDAAITDDALLQLDETTLTLGGYGDAATTVPYTPRGMGKDKGNKVTVEDTSNIQRRPLVQQGIGSQGRTGAKPLVVLTDGPPNSNMERSIRLPGAGDKSERGDIAAPVHAVVGVTLPSQFDVGVTLPSQFDVGVTLPSQFDVESYNLPQLKGVVRRKPGRGDPTLSMSCSDKIARWLLVGMQGALLSGLMNGTAGLPLPTNNGQHGPPLAVDNPTPTNPASLPFGTMNAVTLDGIVVQGITTMYNKNAMCNKNAAQSGVDDIHGTSIPATTATTTPYDEVAFYDSQAMQYKASLHRALMDRIQHCMVHASHIRASKQQQRTGGIECGRILNIGVSRLPPLFMHSIGLMSCRIFPGSNDKEASPPSTVEKKSISSFSLVWWASPSSMWKRKKIKPGILSLLKSLTDAQSVPTLLLTGGTTEVIQGTTGVLKGKKRLHNDAVHANAQSKLCRAALFRRFTEVASAVLMTHRHCRRVDGGRDTSGVDRSCNWDKDSATAESTNQSFIKYSKQETEYQTLNPNDGAMLVDNSRTANPFMSPPNPTYGDVKRAVGKCYQSLWRHFKKELVFCGWIKKPENDQEFTLM